MMIAMVEIGTNLMNTLEVIAAAITVSVLFWSLSR